MNIVFLSPNFPPNYYLFCVALKSAGANVLSIGDTPYDFLRSELKDVITEYYKVDNLNNYDQIVRAIGHLTHKHGKIDRIDSLNEHWLDTEAKVRTDFNIPGINNQTIEFIKFKSKMKEKFEKAGVLYPRGVVVNDINLVRSFAKKVGYPIIAKPDVGVGAINTHKLKDENDIKEFFKNKDQTSYIFEEFIDGDIYSFDGLVDRDGTPVFYTSHRYQCGVMDTVHADDHVYYYSLRDIPTDLVDAGFRVLNAFDLKERFFHLEFFRRKSDNKLVALEVNMRPPGGLTTDMFNFAADLNIYQEWANIITANKFSQNDYRRKYHCGYIGQKFNKAYSNSQEEILNKYGNAIVHHTSMSDIFSVAMGNYGYLVRAEDEKEILEMVEYIHKLKDE